MNTVTAIKGVFAFVIFVAVLLTNIPVIVMSRRSDRLRDDIVGKVMVSLCFADIAVGAVTSAVSAALAWLQPDCVPAAICAFQVCGPEIEMGPFYITQPKPMMISQGPTCKDPTRPTHHSTIIPAKATYFN